MASGKVHAQATKRRLVRWAWSGIALAFIQPASLGLTVGLVLGHLITPDIDHPWWTHEEQRVYHWNHLAGWVWHLFWWPYQKLHPHRGISHTRFIGTLGRFLYLLWGPLALTPWAWKFWLFVYAGWLLQDEVHLKLDRRNRV